MKKILKTDKLGAIGKQKMNKTSRNFLILGILVIIVFAVNAWVIISNNQQVSIVTLDKAVAQGGMITPDMFKEGKMSKKDYNSQGIIEVYEGFKRRAIVLWEDRETIKTAYAAHYIRGGTPLYWDALTSEQPKDYAYLYQMDGELLRLEVDALHFGNMLIPGDKLNVRVTYEENDYTLLSDSEYNALIAKGSVQVGTVPVESMLFSNVTVLDMLNTEGDSIFDMYYKLLNYSTKEQKEMAASKEFKALTKPQTILLNVTAEEADAYMRIMKKNPSFMLTLLPRETGNVITEALSDLGIK